MSNISNITREGLNQTDSVTMSMFRLEWEEGKVMTDIINATTSSETCLDNTTSRLLQMCGDDTLSRCYTYEVAKYIVLGLNILSVLVNISHIVLVRRVPELHCSTYLFTLQLISVADIYSTTSLLSILCPLHEALLGKNIYYASLVGTIDSHSGLIRFDTLAVASLERYLCICWPIFWNAAK